MVKTNKVKEFPKRAINKMMEIAGHDVRYEDLEGDWYQQYTMTTEQETKWKQWFSKEAKKLKIINAEMEYEWFNLSYGLKNEDNNI